MRERKKTDSAKPEQRLSSFIDGGGGGGVDVRWNV